MQIFIPKMSENPIKNKHLNLKAPMSFKTPLCLLNSSGLYCLVECYIFIMTLIFDSSTDFFPSYSKSILCLFSISYKRRLIIPLM